MPTKLSLNGSAAGWLRAIFVIICCVGAIAFGYGSTKGDIRVLAQRTSAIEVTAHEARKAASAAKLEASILSRTFDRRLRDLQREVACSSAKLDLLLQARNLPIPLPRKEN